MSEIATTPFDILQQAQSGDMVQVGALYEHYHLGVYRYLFYLLGDQHLAEDLTSEVFLRMIRSLPQYRLQGASFRAWLYRIARNLAVDHIRKVKQYQQVSVEENLPAAMFDPLSQVEQELDSERLKLCLAQLSSEQREVVILRFVVGLPISEVANALNKSLDAIKGLQRRGLTALRAMLIDLEVENE